MAGVEMMKRSSAMRLKYLKQVAGILLLLYLVYPPPGHSQSTETPERWVDSTPSEWPQIAMINQIDYSDTTYAVAGCAFLLDTGDEILAATAKHILRYFKSESMSSVSFRGTLRTWRMFPKDAPSSITVVDRLINENEEESLDRIPSGKDWLLFTVREYPINMQPLRLRSTPFQLGETVFIIGWRYTDEGSQRIYKGKYVDNDAGSILISTEALTDNTVPGLSGAPVIDSNGYVIGLMSSKAGKMERLASVDYPNALLKERRLSGIEYPTPIVRPLAQREMQEPKCPREPARCAQQMAEHFKERGWVGITPDIDPDTGVISVADVFSDSPAQRAGLQAGDIVRGLNGMKHNKTDNEAFMRAYDSFRLGDKVIYNVERGGEQLDIEVHLEKIPEAILAQWVNQHVLEYHRAETGTE
jgi:hypothetical protein